MGISGAGCWFVDFLGHNYIYPIILDFDNGERVSDSDQLKVTGSNIGAHRWEMIIELQPVRASVAAGLLGAHRAEHGATKSFELACPQGTGYKPSAANPTTAAATVIGESVVSVADSTNWDNMPIGQFITIGDDKKVYMAIAKTNEPGIPNGFLLAAQASQNDTSITIDGASTNALTAGMRFAFGSVSTIYKVVNDVAAGATDADDLTVEITPAIDSLIVGNNTALTPKPLNELTVTPSFRKVVASGATIDVTPNIQALYDHRATSAWAFGKNAMYMPRISILEKV